jgi:ATP-dependent DNA helicase RecG
MPTFKVANPLRDERLLHIARELAADILSRDPELTGAENAGIRRALTERYSRALELFRVG